MRRRLAVPAPRPQKWPLRARNTATVTRQHVPGTMSYAGHSYPRYLVWHPLDHISYEVIDIRVDVEELGPNRAVIVKRVLGTTMVRLARAGLNLIAHRRAFPDRRIEPWVTHHVEEIGNLEHFLPRLHAAETQPHRGTT